MGVRSIRCASALPQRLKPVPNQRDTSARVGADSRIRSKRATAYISHGLYGLKKPSEKLLGKIIHLSREIRLHPDPRKPDYGLESFISSSGPNILSGVGISWFYSEKAFAILNDIGFLLSIELTEFTECDVEFLKKAVRKTLQDLCRDHLGFDGDAVFFAREATLFECRAIKDARRYAGYVFVQIQNCLRSQIVDFCVIYVAPRISGPSFLVESEGLWVIDKRDRQTWKELCSKGYCLDELNQDTGMLGEPRHRMGFYTQNFDYYFVATGRGPQENCNFECSLRLRKLFSILFAFSEMPGHNKVEAEPYRYSLSIPHKSASDRVVTMSSIGDLVPYYGSTMQISKQQMQNILGWYEAESGLPQEQRNRIATCAHFVNRGMNTDDIESFINYFISLDALFGERHSVEKTILKGIKALVGGEQLIKKASQLFNLRSELVHGGSRHINEWPRFKEYYEQFRSDPAMDVRELSFMALRSAPRVLTETLI